VKKYFIFLILSLVVAVLVLRWQSIQNNGLAGILPLQPNAQQVSTSSIILPGPMPQFSCPPQTKGPTLISIVKTSGISTYKINGVSDYVLPSGSKGSIVYSTSTTGFIKTSSGVEGVGYASASQNTNQSYNLSFYHQTQVSENYTITPVNTTNQSRKYKICGNIATVGTVCKYQSSKTKPANTKVSVSSSSHPGVSSRVLKVSSGAQNVTINTTSSAQQGTYWISIGGSPCNGGQLALLTLGSSQYNGTIPNTTKYG